MLQLGQVESKCWKSQRLLIEEEPSTPFLICTEFDCEIVQRDGADE